MNSKVSVIIPAYRSEAFISQAVKSVLAQTHKDWEIVIAADDMQDYVAILQQQGISDARMRCVTTGGMGSGVANARSTALDAASGRYIASLDADDALHPDALASLLPHMQQHGAAYSRIRLVDFDSGNELRHNDMQIDAGVKEFETIITSNLHTFAGVMYDRTRLPHVRWLERVIRWEDMLFFASCCDVLGGMFHVPLPLYDYHRRQGSVCTRPETAQEFRSWAQQLTQEIESGGLPEIKNPEIRAVLVRFFNSRATLEKLFDTQQRANPGLDWLEFMHNNRELFYSV